MFSTFPRKFSWAEIGFEFGFQVNSLFASLKVIVHPYATAWNCISSWEGVTQIIKHTNHLHTLEWPGNGHPAFGTHIGTIFSPR